jgi:hypothetical protein
VLLLLSVMFTKAECRYVYDDYMTCMVGVIIIVIMHDSIRRGT